MRESRTYGSVRGALSNERPYRDPAKSACPGVFDDVSEAFARGNDLYGTRVSSMPSTTIFHVPAS